MTLAMCGLEALQCDGAGLWGQHAGMIGSVFGAFPKEGMLTY